MLDRQIVKAAADGVDILERKFAMMGTICEQNKHSLFRGIDPQTSSRES